MTTSALSRTSEFNPPLRMLWAELTRSCNEHCGHCYNDSGAHRAGEEKLGADDWFRILADARDRGASEVQFIGGEPTLVPWLADALLEAKRLGYTGIEIYTNGTRLSDSLISVCAQNGVSVAVSIYSHEPAIHDRITMLEGSHERTLDALRRAQGPAA